MTNRENILAILNYQSYDYLPLINFGYWNETVDKWAGQGHISYELAEGYKKSGGNSTAAREIMNKLGFDYNWGDTCFGVNTFMSPEFTPETLETKSDGSTVVRDAFGLICVIKPGVVSIPSEIGTTLADRKSWEEEYKFRFEFKPSRIDSLVIRALPKPEGQPDPQGLFIGSLVGNMRNMLGVMQMSYLYTDDVELYKEIVDTLCGLIYQSTKAILEAGGRFDYAHFWEDICFKNGPLVSPMVFNAYFAPWYKKITTLLKEYGVNIVSLDCDGCIDALIPIWLENGVNTMFPIEVGTWEASIKPWRQTYGRDLRGVGGMNKNVFSLDRNAIDYEVERLSKLVALGGYIPCPDHRIAPDAKWELVQYYCDCMRRMKM